MVRGMQTDRVASQMNLADQVLHRRVLDFVVGIQAAIRPTTNEEERASQTLAFRGVHQPQERVPRIVRMEPIPGGMANQGSPQTVGNLPPAQQVSTHSCQ